MSFSYLESPNKSHGNYSVGSTSITVIVVVESECLKESIEDYGHINDNQVMIDYSSLTAASSGIIIAWSTSNSYSNAADCRSHVVDLGSTSYTTHDDHRLLGISFAEDYRNLHHHENITHQLFPPLTSISGSRFNVSTIRWVDDQSNHFILWMIGRIIKISKMT
jgi:hypothetical protein